MQNSFKKSDSKNKSLSKPKKFELILTKINIKEKPNLKKYLTQFFDNPEKFFTSVYSNKKIVLNKIKSPQDIYELPLPKRLQKRFKSRQNKAIQFLNDNSMKDHLVEIASMCNNSKDKKRKENIEIKKDKADKREINDQEINKIFSVFETVRNINKNRINNFITKNQYVDMMHKTKNINEEEKSLNNDNEKNEIIIEDQNEQNSGKKKKFIKCKSSSDIRNDKNDIENKIMSSKVIKFHDKINNYNNNINQKLEITIPKLTNSLNKNFIPFKSVFEKPNSQRNIINRNDEYISSLTSQYSTLYKSRNKTSWSNLKNIFNKYPETQSAKNPEKILLKKQSQYILDNKNKTIKKELLKRLAIQEKALESNSEYNNNTNNMIKFIAKKINKEKNDIMLGQNDDYRVIKDIKTQMNNLIKKNHPDKFYNWKYNLRSDSACHYNKIDNIQKEIVRNPLSVINKNNIEKKFKRTEGNFIKRNVSAIGYKKYLKDMEILKGNFNGLLIEGQNLLKYEQDLIKQIKGKKFLINYNNSIQDKDINDALYAYNIHINKYIRPK